MVIARPITTFAEVVAEHEIPSLLLYVLMMSLVIKVALEIRDTPTIMHVSRVSELQACSIILISSLIANYAAGNFSNSIGLKARCFCFAPLASLYELRRKETRVGAEGEKLSFISRMGMKGVA